MPLLRLMSACILGSMCVLQAAAQSPATPSLAPKPAPQATATPHAAGIRTPPLSTKFTLLLTAKPTPAPSQFKAPAEPSPIILSTTNDSSCFSMRSYNFTANDLQSSSPTPSTYTTCSPARTLALKDATVTLVK